jgi:hypothetical protein
VVVIYFLCCNHLRIILIDLSCASCWFGFPIMLLAAGVLFLMLFIIPIFLCVLLMLCRELNELLPDQ